MIKHEDTTAGAGVVGLSEGAKLPTEVGIIKAKGVDTGHIVLLTRFDSVLFTPTNAIRLGWLLIRRGLAEAVGR
ncbi:hypothetical protein [Nocardia wallacei]|uniref:hypothetical protein n=1 Tax=Nocardia wallacei TaxID=480035 RepID=UPI0024549725|nr:hypothetical protein [Nocardia wallacei]